MRLQPPRFLAKFWVRVRVELVAMLLAWQPVTVGEAIIFSASPPHTLASIGPAAHNFAPYAFQASFIRCDEHRAHQRVSPSRFSPSPSHNTIASGGSGSSMPRSFLPGKAFRDG